MAIALALELHSTKTKILETYLQSAYWGHGAVGVAQAASIYFQKQPQDLTVNEAALLAATLPSPETLSPLRDRAGATQRLEKVLHSMHLMGYLSDSQLEKALLEGLPASLAAQPMGRGLPKNVAGASHVNACGLCRRGRAESVLPAE
jgi:penicillin-binding protein 1A